ncbi:hypothetical protein SETIT_3G065900v2 [Setaria italica]|uniref:PGR5-like protein 1A, chloroplastic n=2 Tax=Setaria italica TaxID=4555 RepID=A0A368QC98_SETIT|nr:PGR5-like protein 1B, chloroplastic [Setaria italica]RCV15559.1 hypothetical protein SETIT_3G065900v2 [Setaria italica]
MPDLLAFLLTLRRAPFPRIPPVVPPQHQQERPTKRAGAAVQLRSMAAAAPVAPGSGRVSRLRPRPTRVGLRGAGAVVAAAEGPSCLYVGPIETASQEKLEALYHQARDSYYSGQPLIVDDMFDKVELKLRLYGSKSVVKYPRCSLIRQSTYADAEEDQSMFMALSSIWMLLLLFGTSAFLVPSLYTLNLAFGDAFGARHLLYGAESLDAITRVNDLALVGLGYLVGYPIASASVGALRGLLSNNLVALKGSCPNCGEQVFAFVKTDKSIRAPHRAECHVCECPLEYRTKIEKSLSGPRRTWVYGRVYLVKQGHPRKRKWIND